MVYLTQLLDFSSSSNYFFILSFDRYGYVMVRVFLVFCTFWCVYYVYYVCVGQLPEIKTDDDDDVSSLK